MASLPGPPSPSCKASFRENDFHIQEICLEVWWRRNTFAAIAEYLNIQLRQNMNEWIHITMADLGFPETYALRFEHLYQPAALPYLKPSHFTPSLSFRFTLMMQGVCLFPFTKAKQIALESVLIPLMGKAGSVFTLKSERVAYAAPIVTHAANRSAYSYFFVNVTILCGKFEGANFKELSQLFGADGPFMGKGGGPSPLQQALESVGLPVAALKAAPPQLLQGHPPVTPRDRIQSMREQQRRWRWRGPLAAGLTGTALLVASLFLTGAFQGLSQWRAVRRREAPSGTIPTSVDLIEPASTDFQGLSSNETMQLLRTLSQKTREGEARDSMAEDRIVDTEHLSILDAEKHAMAIPTNEMAGGLMMQSTGRDRLTPLDIHTDLLGLSRGSNAVCITDDKEDVALQSAADTGHSDPFPCIAMWDVDRIPPQTLAICRRPDGTPWHLGRGSFGQVVKGVRDGVHEVALKISRPGFPRELIMREMSLLKSCKNSNIVQFLGVCHRRDSVWLVMEYMPGGDLHSFLKRQKNWSWGPRAAELALGISRGVAYLHSQRVIHMDLKSGNVLLTSGGQAKVADVGMAHILAESRTHGSNLEIGTFAYTAPEIILYGKGGWSADIYSLGVILWELVTGKVPVRGRMHKLRYILYHSCIFSRGTKLSACYGNAIESYGSRLNV
eukprot:jgi/Botrbrau1/23626/Bobra.55_2s0017.2